MGYLGSSVCCFTFETLNLESYYNATFKYSKNFLVQIDKSTVLKGKDYIAVIVNDFKTVLVSHENFNKVFNKFFGFL